MKILKKMLAIMLLSLVVGCEENEQTQKQTSADHAARLAADQNVPKTDDGGTDDVKTFRYPREEASAQNTPAGQLTTGSSTEESGELPQGQPKRWTLIMDTDKVESATEADLSRIGGQEFAVLVDNADAKGLTYIQCDLDLGKYALEYQDGSTEKHYRATDFRLPLDRVIEAFTKYLNDDDSWKADFQWKRLTID